MSATQNEIYTVTSLTTEIKNVLSTRFPRIKVKGEVTNLRRQQSGHVYFSLKDEQSQISCVLFAGIASKLSKLPKDGDQITIEGEISLYAPRGTYQIIVRSVSYDGVGDLLLKLYALKEELSKLGYFDKERKRALPKFPKVIGVVTSPTGAVIQDILHVLKRRYPSIEVVLNPVSVQGEGASKDIAKAIDDFNAHALADLLIVGRGGGSLEDLWAFNERIVADALHRSRIPTISAVGHETDFSIADFVADLRAPTPSAAAELAVPDRESLLMGLERGQKMLRSHLKAQIESARLKLEKVSSHPMIKDPSLITLPYTQKIDIIGEDLKRTMHMKLDGAKVQLQNKKEQLSMANPMATLKQAKERFTRLIAHLNSVNPKNILQKGYAIVFQENKTSVIMSSKDLQPGDNLSVQFSDGATKVKVEGNI
jgi:exodeoxyribonuclease VII large subunit